MKTYTTLLSFLFLFQLSISAFGAGEAPKDSMYLPENALIISISPNPSGLFYTMIDTDNNEMVIVYYGTDLDYPRIKYFELRKVIRTGIKIDPVKQIMLMNTNRTREENDESLIITQ